MTFETLPGGTLIQQGLADIAASRDSAEALLVMIGAPRLRSLGFDVPETGASDPETRLYELLAESDTDSAHSRYNAMIRLLVSFERGRRIRRVIDVGRVREFMRALGVSATSAGRVYFTGGVTALLMKWRDSTVDIDIKMVPEQDALFRALPSLKESLEMNIELAAPDQFIPTLDGWEDRSQFIATEKLISFHHYDFYSQALSKIERGHARDMLDVAAMVRLGLVDREKCVQHFNRIEPQLYLFPAIDPPSFRRAVERVMQNEVL